MSWSEADQPAVCPALVCWVQRCMLRCLPTGAEGSCVGHIWHVDDKAAPHAEQEACRAVEH